MKNNEYKKWILIISIFIPPIFVAFSVFLSIPFNFKSFNVSVPGEIVESSRKFPTIDVVRVGKNLVTGTSTIPADTREITRMADDLLVGKIAGGGLPRRTLSLPFDGAAVAEGNSSWQLNYAGFLVPKILFRAYGLTRQDKYLIGARDFILGWLDYESNALIPAGYLWNDHAIANRGIVLADFWETYRRHPLYDPLTGAKILKLVRLTADNLARPSLYTFRTNHGTMQNIALGKLSVYFPLLEKFKDYGRLAIDRQTKQLRYFIGSEGVVQEHSVGYHIFGLLLLDDFRTLSRIISGAVSAELEARIKQAENFVKVVMRTDQSVPLVGDTYSHSVEALSGRPAIIDTVFNSRRGFDSVSTTLFPKSGYVIHRVDTPDETGSAARSHATVFWANIQAMGHKHSDDLSFHLWADGADWWTASGYWPIARPDRAQGISWVAANAPHLIGETRNRSRKSILLGYASQGRSFVFDGMREVPGKGRIRRQVLALANDIWITVDAFDAGKTGTARVVWTTASDNSARMANKANVIRISSKQSRKELAVQLFNSVDKPSKAVRGSRSPWMGWIAGNEGAEPKTATALVLEQPSQDSWAVNVSALVAANERRFSGASRMKEWVSPENWTLEVNLVDGIVSVVRDANKIWIETADHARKQLLTLQTFTADSLVDVGAEEALKKAVETWNLPFRPMLFYRYRVIGAIAVLFLVEAALWGLFLRRRRKLAAAAAIASPIGWAGLAVWLHFVYFIPVSSL